MFRHAAAVFAATVAFLGVQPAAQPVAPRTSLSQRIDAVLARPEFRHAMFGIELYSLDAGKPIYILNADKLFVPGSTTELVMMGSALRLLGADRRFHTRVYRTGAIGADGALDGDLVLVASGDMNLSGRLRPVIRSRSKTSIIRTAARTAAQSTAIRCAWCARSPHRSRRAASSASTAASSSTRASSRKASATAARASSSRR